MGDRTPRHLGSIYTPPDFAQFLTSWAIRTPKDKVLDIGFGEGAFIFAAYHRLLELGASFVDAPFQIHGAEIDSVAFDKCRESANGLSVCFPNLHHGDFFDMEFPPLDAVVGNPPYVRRVYLEEIDRIRQSVIWCNQDIGQADLPRQTDLYVYSLLHAFSFLKPGGRAAVIMADPWLNTRYGEGFRRYLRKNFQIDSLISMDRRVFNDAQVKPVLLLATKRENIDADAYVHFIRVRNGLPISSVQHSVQSKCANSDDIKLHKLRTSDLGAVHPWGVHFKAPEVYELLASHDLLVPMEDVAQTRIGLQTLAKEFFVLTQEDVKLAQIESEFLRPLAHSARWFNEPTIESSRQPTHYVFCCSKGKEELQGTNALRYISRGEVAEVGIRGKQRTVTGYQNKERIKEASRKNWYDLHTDLERRGIADILIPRLVYRDFTVVWNKAGFVPGELFIEFLPKPVPVIDKEIYLAILSSSVTEIMLRSHAQVYGGGTYNINPGQIKKVPVVKIGALSDEQKARLKQAYLMYLSDTAHNRVVIDTEIYNILGFDGLFQQRLKDVLQDLVVIATSTKQQSSTNSDSIQERLLVLDGLDTLPKVVQ